MTPICSKTDVVHWRIFSRGRQVRALLRSLYLNREQKYEIFIQQTGKSLCHGLAGRSHHIGVDAGKLAAACRTDVNCCDSRFVFKTVTPKPVEKERAADLCGSFS